MFPSFFAVHLASSFIRRYLLGDIRYIIVNPAEYASELHVDALHPATYHMQDENYIDKAHGRGLRAHVWTVNEKHEMKALVKAEADAIITNYPDIAVEIVKNA